MISGIYGINRVGEYSLMKASETGLTIKSFIFPLLDPMTDFAEMGLDLILPAITDSDVLKELPFIKYFMAVGNFNSAVQTA